MYLPKLNSSPAPNPQVDHRFKSFTNVFLFSEMWKLEPHWKYGRFHAAGRNRGPPRWKGPTAPRDWLPCRRYQAFQTNHVGHNLSHRAESAYLPSGISIQNKLEQKRLFSQKIFIQILVLISFASPTSADGLAYAYRFRWENLGELLNDAMDATDATTRQSLNATITRRDDATDIWRDG